MELARTRPRKITRRELSVTLKEAKSALPKELARKFEDYITYALFPHVAVDALRDIYYR